MQSNTPPVTQKHEDATQNATVPSVSDQIRANWNALSEEERQRWLADELQGQRPTGSRSSQCPPEEDLGLFQGPPPFAGYAPPRYLGEESQHRDSEDRLPKRPGDLEEEIISLIRGSTDDSSDERALEESRQNMPHGGQDCSSGPEQRVLKERNEDRQ